MVHFDFNDILITPAITSKIRSRKEINPFYSVPNKTLPIIVSPMDTVIGLDNWKLFLDKNMTICFPRGVRPQDIKQEDQILLYKYSDMIFFSYSLEEIIDVIKALDENPKMDLYHNILIDIANGHMQHLADSVTQLKQKTKVKIMVGNIANPETYRVLSLAGADFIRVGIGFGGGCLTAMNTGVGHSMASLVYECNKIKQQNILLKRRFAKIVADGGFREYSDVIKALALGSDYVMLGSVLNKCLESSGDTYLYTKLFRIKLNGALARFFWRNKFKLEKNFRGMSTKEVQKKWGRINLKTSEGVVRMRTVKYTLSGWTENFIDYLKSAMSYTNTKDLQKFVGKVEWTQISQNSFNRFNK